MSGAEFANPVNIYIKKKKTKSVHRVEEEGGRE